MEDREAWDALVTAKVAELKAVYQQPASVKVRTRIPEIGEGRGRRRKPLAELGAAARRMRRVNAEKKLTQLVCRVCEEKACVVHCQACGDVSTAHSDDMVICRRCGRATSLGCGGVANTDATLCTDCYVLEEDLLL